MQWHNFRITLSGSECVYMYTLKVCVCVCVCVCVSIKECVLTKAACNIFVSWYDTVSGLSELWYNKL